MCNLALFNEIFYIDTSSPSCLRWKIKVNNRCNKHSIAGCLSKHGYWRVSYKGVNYSVATIVCSLNTNKYFEDKTVDHIDRCPSNNLPCNLRWADRSQQNSNRRLWGFKTMNNVLNSFEHAK